MEISGKVLREVEFRDRLRGYDTDEVDEFLEKVAVAIDEMQAELSRAAGRSQTQSHVRPIDEATPVLDDDAIRRTLVLAQRTADLAVNEAREEASHLLEEARQQSETILAQAHEAVRRMRNDAEQELRDRVGRLEGEHERLERETGSLVSLLEGERERLTQGLSAALRFVEDTLAVPPDLARAADRRPSPEASPDSSGPTSSATATSGAQDGSSASSGEWTRADVPALLPSEDGPSIPDVEAEITEDAATAARHDEPPAPPSVYGLAHTSPPPPLDADEALWTEWASGGRSGGQASQSLATEMPLSFERHPGPNRSA